MNTTNPDRFPGHQPGEEYSLTREEFARFAGLDCLYRSFVTSPAIAGYCGDFATAERVAFWAAVAAFEARRWFNDSQRCESELYCDEEFEGGALSWCYTSTSGTVLAAFEHRSGDGEPSFTVTIPADRDQPGRYHHEQLRQGGTYCD